MYLDMTKIVLCLIILMSNLMITHSKDQEMNYNSFQKKYSRSSSSSKISLSGRLATPTSRSISQPIEVFLYNKILNIYFVSYLDIIEITISNDSNTNVYSEVISVSDKSKSLVDLSKFTEGIYVIRFKDSEGGELRGMFTVE